MIFNERRFFRGCGYCYVWFPHCASLVKEDNNTSLFIIISHCFTVRLSNQLAFRVSRALTLLVDKQNSGMLSRVELLDQLFCSSHKKVSRVFSLADCALENQFLTHENWI